MKKGGAAAVGDEGRRATKGASDWFGSGSESYGNGVSYQKSQRAKELKNQLNPSMTGEMKLADLESIFEYTMYLMAVEPSRRIDVEKAGKDEEELARETSSRKRGDDGWRWDEAGRREDGERSGQQKNGECTEI